MRRIAFVLVVGGVFLTVAFAADAMTVSTGAMAPGPTAVPVIPTSDL